MARDERQGASQTVLTRPSPLTPPPSRSKPSIARCRRLGVRAGCARVKSTNLLAEAESVMRRTRSRFVSSGALGTSQRCLRKPSSKTQTLALSHSRPRRTEKRSITFAVHFFCPLLSARLPRKKSLALEGESGFACPDQVQGTAYSPERRNRVSMVVRRDLVSPTDFSSADGAGVAGSTGAGTADSGINFFGACVGSGAGGHPTGPAGRTGTAGGIDIRACWPSSSTQYITLPV